MELFDDNNADPATLADLAGAGGPIRQQSIREVPVKVSRNYPEARWSFTEALVGDGVQPAADVERIIYLRGTPCDLCVTPCELDRDLRRFPLAYRPGGGGATSASLARAPGSSRQFSNGVLNHANQDPASRLRVAIAA
jgi:hypothetical protein